MQNNIPTRNKKENALKQVSVARSNLLLMIVLTAINVVLFALGTNTMLLFSATVPYFIAMVGLLSDMTALSVICVGISAALLLAYLLCWIYSKKNYGWMVAALILFAIDTAAMVLLYVWMGDISGILDVVIHIWVLYYLIIGVKYGHTLQNLSPEDEAEFELANTPAQIDALPKENSAALRVADQDVKFRVFAEVSSNGYDICYRRVKRVNELIINGYVYDSVEMLIETAHELKAIVDGHEITAGFDGVASYIRVDGAQVKRKIRLV